MADLTTATMMNSTTKATASTATESTLTATTTNNPTIEVETELYPWAKDNVERRRSFIFEYFGWNPDYAGKIQVEQLSQIEQWLLGR